jgi:hypothetical protein
LAKYQERKAGFDMLSPPIKGGFRVFKEVILIFPLPSFPRGGLKIGLFKGYLSTM